MDSELILYFRTAHQSIVNSIDETQTVMRSYVQVKPKVRELREMLLAHFGKQNNKLYDELRDLHRSNRESLKMIEFLTEDLKDIKIKYMVFLDKHSGEMDDINARTFPRDFLIFSQDVIARLRIEEDYLLPLIDKTLS